MKNPATTHGIDTGVGQQQRSLLRNLVLLTLLIIGLGMSIMLYFDARIVDTLSRKLIDKSSFATEQQLSHFFRPLEKSLLMTSRRLHSLDAGERDIEEILVRRLSPFMDQYPQVTGFTMSDLEGNNHFRLTRDNGEYLTRLVEEGDNRNAQWKRWKKGKLIESWTRHTDFDPIHRPWFTGALESAPGVVHWTEPYPFYTNKKPGMTVSVKGEHPESGDITVFSYDVLLADISRYTMDLRPSENGMALVVSDDKRLVGLPPDERFQDERAINSGLLAPVADLNHPVLDDGFAEWEKLERTTNIFPFTSNHEGWWAGFKSYDIGADQRVWEAVLVPEADFLSGINRTRNLAVAGVMGLGILIAAMMILGAVRSMRRNLRNAVSQIERTLGQYKLVYKIGDGGNGAVYRARHALLRRPTAVKLMHPEYARSETAKARFEHEVQIMSGLANPNTVAVYDYGQSPDGTLYYVMEYLTGINLESLVQVNGPQPAARIIHILQQVCFSLNEAHEKNLIHRDIKPSNIMLCERGGMYDVIKVLDFGLVKELSEKDPALTQVNTLVGTPLYMAPEIISTPGLASPQSDLYALGAVGYFLLTGHNVFDGDSAVQICASHLHDAPVPPSQRTRQPVPEDLERIILQCLDKDPGRRPASAGELVELMSQCRDNGLWTREDARAWWVANEVSLPLDDEQQTHQPLSNTQLLVDVDERLVPGTYGQPPAK